MPHISYSELKDWSFCAFYHKLTRIDKIDGFKGNAFTAFGTAIHDVCEKKLLKEDINEEIQDALDDYFEEYEVLAVEFPLMLDIPGEEDYKFKGYIDAIVVTPDGKIHIFDWKTCSWGWDARRKNDKMTTYQLTLYKHFFALAADHDPKDIETHFALLKRTAKNNRVEFFRVTSGPKKTQNALKLLNMALWNIKKQRYIKNRLSCTTGYGCKFHNTKHCP